MGCSSTNFKFEQEPELNCLNDTDDIEIKVDKDKELYKDIKVRSIPEVSNIIIDFNRFKKKSFRMLFLILPDYETLLPKIKLKKLHQTIIHSSTILDRTYNHNHSISSILRLSGNKLATVGNYIKIWNLLSGKCLTTLTDDKFISLGIVCILQLSETRIVSGGFTEVRIWDFVKGTCISRKRVGESVFSLLKLNDTRFISGNALNFMQVWSYTGECIFTLEHPGYQINLLKLNENQFVSMVKYNICFGDDRLKEKSYIKIWDYNTGTNVESLFSCNQNYFKKTLGSLLRIDDNHFAHWSRIGDYEDNYKNSYFYKSKIHIWNAELNEKTIELNNMINCLLKISKEIVVFGTNKNTLVLNINTSQKLLTINEPSINLYKLNNYTIVSKNQNVLNVWDIFSNKIILSSSKNPDEYYTDLICLRLNDHQFLVKFNSCCIKILNIN